MTEYLFQLELAHWFYLDEYVSSDSNKKTGELRSCTIREFAFHMFKHVRFLRCHVERVRTIYRKDILWPLSFSFSLRYIHNSMTTSTINSKSKTIDGVLSIKDGICLITYLAINACPRTRQSNQEGFKHGTGNFAMHRNYSFTTILQIVSFPGWFFLS